MKEKQIGKYRIISTLGVGGMGVVYRAEHIESGRVVALKTINVPKATHIFCIRREIQALSEIDHPGIIRVFDHGIFNGSPWYAMEFVTGKPLREIIGTFDNFRNPMLETRTHSLSSGSWTVSAEDGLHRAGGIGSEVTRYRIQPEHLQEVFRLSMDIAQAVSHIHRQGIIHGDLNPNNIMIRSSGRPVIVDFGLTSWFGGSGTREMLDDHKRSVGTVLYTAPEQILGDYLDGRADLYSLGVMMYEMLTGRQPFRGDTVLDVIQRVMEHPLTPPSEWVDGIPPLLEELILKLLSRQRSKRCAYSDDVVNKLSSMMNEDYSLFQRKAGRIRYMNRTSLVGRKPELRRMLQWVDSGEGHAGGFLFLTGVKGSGKTRMIMDLTQRLRDRNVTVYIGRGGGFSHSGEGVIRESQEPMYALRNYMQAVIDRWREGFADGALEDAEVQEIYTLQALCGTPRLRQPGSLPLPSTHLGRVKLYNYLLKRIVQESRQQSVVFILDDLQWADDLTIGFLGYIKQFNYLAAHPVFIIGCYRTDDIPSGRRKIFESLADHSLELKPLSNAEISELIREVLASDDPPDILTGSLVTHAAGNPSVVMEYLRLALSQGLLKRRACGHWEMVADSFDATIAEGSWLDRHALLRHGIKKLTVDARYVLEMTAVWGKPLPERILTRLVDLPANRLVAAVNELIRMMIVRFDENGHLVFEHTSYLLGIYQKIPTICRRGIHMRIAGVIQSLGSDGEEFLSAEEGFHWEAAGEPFTAASRYLNAARQLKSIQDMAGAERMLRKVLGLAAEDSEIHRSARREISDVGIPDRSGSSESDRS